MSTPSLVEVEDYTEKDLRTAPDGSQIEVTVVLRLGDASWAVGCKTFPSLHVLQLARSISRNNSSTEMLTATLILTRVDGDWGIGGYKFNSTEVCSHATVHTFWRAKEETDEIWSGVYTSVSTKQTFFVRNGNVYVFSPELGYWSIVRENEVPRDLKVVFTNVGRGKGEDTKTKVTYLPEPEFPIAG